jgi:predicted SAM-dependent methyltransferase
MVNNLTKFNHLTQQTNHMKIQFGCGGNLLDGWQNHDIEVDIAETLPYVDNSALFVYASHVVEHVLPAQALSFFKECHRILVYDGVMRITVPSIARVYQMADQEYLDWLGRSGFGQPTRQSAIENLIVNHGHLAVWSHSTLCATIYAAGFDVVHGEVVGDSCHPELRGIDHHGKVIGEHNNWVESIVVEAIKK